MFSRASVVALCVLGASGFVVNSGSGLLDGALDNLERQMAFFSADYSDINVDGLFGLRMAQGQIIAAVEECHKRPACSASYLTKLKKLESTLQQTSDKALPYVKDSDLAYYQRFYQTIAKAWILPYHPTLFDDAELRSVKLGTNTSYDENYGDACYARIMGTFDKNLARCTVTPECWDFMTSEGTSQYALTHQLLYFIVIEHVGCVKDVERNLQGKKIRDVQSRMCQKIYKEAENLVRKGNVKSLNRDLFLEQTVLCGPLGYESFMREDWMTMTLRWLDTHFGCFRMTLTELEQLSDQMVDDVYKGMNVSKETIEKAKQMAEQESKESFEQQEEKEAKTETNSSPTMRKLMREKGMKDDCMAHTSGLGFGVYATYLNFLIMHT